MTNALFSTPSQASGWQFLTNAGVYGFAVGLHNGMVSEKGALAVFRALSDELQSQEGDGELIRTMVGPNYDYGIVHVLRANRAELEAVLPERGDA